jgi:heme/copper-type cytochrome/quinol oxidase subunit 3
MDPTTPYREPTTTPPPEGSGSILASACRLGLGLAAVCLLGFASQTAAQPSCGPWPKPDRWPSLLPVLIIGALLVAGGWWSLGRLARRAPTVGRALAMLGVTAGVLAALFVALLYMSFVTLC